MEPSRIEALVESLGFEVVSIGRGGGRRGRLAIRIDRPDGQPGQSGITVEDCGRVMRALREALGDEAEDRVIEVSSPGVERPLNRPRDYERFAGQRVRLRGYRPIGDHGKVLEGRLVGWRDGTVELEVDGEAVRVRHDAIAAARLVYDWQKTS